jgi:hypothetical protein
VVKKFSPGCGSCRVKCQAVTCLPDSVCWDMTGFTEEASCPQSFPLVLPVVTAAGADVTYRLGVFCNGSGYTAFPHNTQPGAITYTVTCQLAIDIAGSAFHPDYMGLHVHIGNTFEYGANGLLVAANPFEVANTPPPGFARISGGANAHYDAQDQDWAVTVTGAPCEGEGFMALAPPPARPERCLHLGARAEFKTGCGGFSCLHRCELGHTEDPMEGVGLVRPGGLCQTCVQYQADGGAF